MRKIISRLLFFCILLSVNFVCSQNLNTNNWKINFEKGQQLFEDNNYSEALNFFEDAYVTASSLKTIQKKELGEITYELGKTYSKVKNYKKAIENYNKALIFFKEKDNLNANNIIEILHGLGAVYENIENYPKAIEYLENSLLRIKNKKGKENLEYAEILTELAIVYKKHGSTELALNIALEAVEISRNNRDESTKIYASCLTNLCQIYDEIGEYEMAIPIQQEAISLLKTEDDKSLNYAVAIFTLAKLYGQISDYKNAIRLYENVKEILGKHHANDPSAIGGIASTNNNLGQIYQRLGDYEKAINFNLKVLKKAKEGTSEYGKRAYNVAYNYVQVGEFRKGLEYYNMALKSYKESIGEDHKDYGKLLNNIGKLYYDIKDLNKAEEYFNKALVNLLKNSNENDVNYGYYLNDYANTLFNLGRQEEAIDLMQKNIKIAKKNSRTETEAYVKSQFNLGMAFVKAKKYGDAFPLLSESSEKIKSILGTEHPDYGKMLSGLSETYFAIGQVENAINNLKIANEIRIKQLNEIFRFRSEPEKKAFLNTISEEFGAMQEISFRYKIENPELNSINLNNQLMLKGLLLNNSKNLLEQLFTLNNSEINSKIDYYKNEKIKYAKALTQDLNDRIFNIDSITEVLNAKESELVKIYSENFNTQIAFQKDWRAIQNKLNKNEIAIEFSHFNTSENKLKKDIFYVAYIFNKNDEYPKLVPLFRESELKNQISKKTPNQLYKFRGSSSRSVGNNAELYDLIWKPLELYLSNVNTIYFAPSGLLNQIPLAALVKNKQFLSTKYNLIQLSSTDVLKNDLTEPNKKTLLLIGGVDYNNNGFKIDQTDHTINNNQITSNTEIEEWKYLPGTLSEIERIQSLLDKNQLLFNALSGSKATEENFKKLSGKSPSVLHIATHGFFKEKERHLKNKNELLLKSENPLTRSGLILAGANTITKNKLSTSSEDGVLTALEISNLNLTNTEIVILSACETGLGDIEGSEGVYGLQRAFKMAGVDLIVMSLWQVPDKETAEFMDLFYSKWLKENNVRTAFNNTQKIMQNKYKNEPYKWAAFVLFE